MSSESSNIPITDPYQVLAAYGFVINADGTVTRDFPNTQPTPDLTSPIKDITINQSNNTWARLYLPKKSLTNSSSTTAAGDKKKLPLLLYFHGGGFILRSSASPAFQEYCCNTANELPCIMVTVNYRLAPDHRLPAAYDDAIEALNWVKTTDEVWIREFADLERVYLSGNSSGGNLAYHAGLRAASSADRLLPLKIQGLILHQPYFGGVQRSQSELRLVNDVVIPLCVADVMWELSLPIGVDRDHEYCNPTAGEGLEKFRELRGKVMVTGCVGDPLVDRQIELVKLMERKGVHVVSNFDEGGFHGVEIRDHSKAMELLGLVKSFLSHES